MKHSEKLPVYINITLLKISCDCKFSFIFYCIVNVSIVLYCINTNDTVDRHIYLNLSKSTQSATGLKALKPDANGRYLINVQIFTLLFPFGVQKYIYHPVSKVHAGSFCVSLIHQTLTWTTRSLTCVHDHSCARVYTWGLGTPTASQHNIFDSEKFTTFSCDPDGIQTSVLWILSLTLYQLNRPVTPGLICLLLTTYYVMFMNAEEY